MLTDQQIATFHQDGFIVPEYKLPAGTLESIRRDTDSLIGDDPEMHQFVPTLIDHDPKFIEYARDPTLLDMVEQIAGPDFVLWNVSLFGKPAHDGKKVPWHQDGEYWPIRPLATTRVWIALDDSTPENGCLRYVRGSHRRHEIAAHHEAKDHSLLLQYGIDPTELDLDNVFDLELEAGGMGIHDVFMVHGSEANITATPRRALVMNFMPTTSRFDHKLAVKQFAEMDINFDHSRRPLFQMRGVDRCGINDFEIGLDTVGASGPARSG